MTTAIMSFQWFFWGSPAFDVPVNGITFVYHLLRAYKEEIMIAIAGAIGCLCFIPGNHSYGYQGFRIKGMAFSGTVGIVFFVQSNSGPIALMVFYLVACTICLSFMRCLAEMVQLRLVEYPRTLDDEDLGYTVGWVYW